MKTHDRPVDSHSINNYDSDDIKIMPWIAAQTRLDYSYNLIIQGQVLDP